MASEIKEEYTSSLADLTMNSKPLINVLTMLAEENLAHADLIVEAIISHLEKVRDDYKLPVLYLIDSIIKNVGGAYTNLFTQKIVSTFISVFKKVDERTRAQMYKLRLTWNEVFPVKKLYALDVQVFHIDPAWPITAPTPTPTAHTIHVNPKFFNKPKVPAGSSITTPVSSAPVIPAAVTAVAPTALKTANSSSTTTVDPHLQEQLNSLNIKKQQLLELQQKKLELALLQQKIQQLEKQNLPKTPQQLLLKPEVAKQLVSQSPLASVVIPGSENAKIAVGKVKPPTMTCAVKVHNNQHQQLVGPGPRLQTVVTANTQPRPAVRDPRLLKQQAEANLFESNVFHDNVSLVDRNKVNNTINVDCATNNKTLNNKPSARSSTFTPRDPRLVNSKVDDGKSSNSRRSSPSKSASTSPRKSVTKSSRSKGTNSNSSDSSKNSSPSSVPKKNYKDDSSGENAARTSRSPSKSPLSKHKKRDGIPTATHDDKRSKSKSDKSTSSSRRSGKDNSADSMATGFKAIKGSTKNRNYMRRNRTLSVSPDPALDVDLRVGAPPDKLPRLQDSTSVATATTTSSETLSKNETLDQVKDVDLRLQPAFIAKKRTSTEIMEANFAKKSKSEKLDILFGNEDVDLRTITSQSQPVVDRPPTPPPPPIISSGKTDNAEGNSKVISKSAENTSSKPDLDALRAKLANATGKGSKQFAQSRINLLVEQQKVQGRSTEDTDLRIGGLNGATEDASNKIIISPADEQSIKTGKMSQAQYNALINKVVEHFEIKKLREAQKKDSENLTNISLQPISDDELSADFSHSDSEEEKEKSKEKREPEKDKDDYNRKRPTTSSQTVSDESSRSREKRNNTETKTGEPRRKHNRWAPIAAPGVVRRRKWDSPPPPHPEPWLRPPMTLHPYGPWRPVAAGPPFIRPPVLPDGFHNMGMPEPAPLPQVPATLPEYVRVDSPPALGQFNMEFPPASPMIIEMIEKDTMKNIQIDKIPRDIRFYDDVAVCIMNWDDPRQILFQNGSAMITFNEKESYVLNFNEPYKEISINGKPHKVKFGAPTREIYIDGNFYDCQFGGPGIGIEIDGNMTVVKLEGQTPQVKIGQPRKDLVAGKINLIVDARSMIPLFLDPKPQRFDIEGKVHTLRFADALQTVLINEVPYKVEFGGLPKPIQVYDRKHFLRFSVLPRGIKPGSIKIKNMQGYQPALSPVYNDEMSQDVPLHEASGDFDTNTPALPMVGMKKHKQLEKDANSDRNSPLMGNFLQQNNFSGLDVLSSVVASNVVPSNNFSGYSVENTNSRDAPVDLNENSSSAPPGTEPTPLLNTVPSVLPLNININDLFQKLVESGIVTSNTVDPNIPPVPAIPAIPTNVPPPNSQPLNTMPPSLQPVPSMQHTVPPPMLPNLQQQPPPIQKPFKIPKRFNISPVLFSQPETLKVRQASIITSLYTGMQCSSCGVRFPPEQSMYYSQHLDWHFRQNRRGKNSIRKAMSRRWYYSLSDWKNYEEIEDLEEREKSWFENQQQQQLEAGAEEQEEEIEIPSVPADNDVKEACCEVCRDKFEQFYNEEKEEWHLRMAVRVDDKTYHPLCYEDYKSSLLTEAAAAALEDAQKLAEKGDDTFNETESISEDDIKIIEKDVEVITVLDTSEKDKESGKDEEMTEVEGETENTSIAKEEEKVEESEEMETDKAEEEIANKDEEDDDDVIIHEVIPEKIDIANDDDDLDKDYMGLIPGVVVKQEPIDDDFMDVDEVKIRNDPIDADLHVQKVNTVSADTTLAGLVSSIDGNVQLECGIPPTTGGVGGGKIKINITKPMVAPTPKEPVAALESDVSSDYIVDPNQPLPPGEEPVQLNLKPVLQGLALKKQPLVKRGSELTGLCSIM